MRAQVQRGGRGVHGGERRSVAWPDGEAAMAPRHAEAMMASECHGGRRARSSGAVMASSARSSAAAAGVANGRQWRSARGRCSGGAASMALLGARVQGVKEEREKREKEREVRELTLNFLKIFNWSSKKFEYESFSKFKILQLSFQAHFHLRFGLKVTNSNLNAKEITLNTSFFEFFSKFCVLT